MIRPADSHKGANSHQDIEYKYRRKHYTALSEFFEYKRRPPVLLRIFVRRYQHKCYYYSDSAAGYLNESGKTGTFDK